MRKNDSVKTSQRYESFKKTDYDFFQKKDEKIQILFHNFAWKIKIK